MIYYSKITTKHTKEKAIKLFKLNKIQISSVIFDEESTTKISSTFLVNFLCIINLILFHSLNKNYHSILEYHILLSLP